MFDLKLWRWLTVLVLLAAAPVVAQDAPPTPAPLPTFHMPTANGETAPTAPTERVVETIPIKPDTAAEAIATVTAEPQPVTLTAIISDGGQPIGEGVVWRVFNTSTDTAGQLELAAKSDKAVAQLALAPGNYVVHAAYGRAQASETITVAEGANSKNVVLEAGGLRLNAAVTGDVAIPINLLRFDVFTAGATDSDRALVAQGIGANDILTVNAGTYHIISYFGDVNAVVRADLRVEPGQLTDATLYHRAAQISFKLVSEAGGEAIADVDWTVKPAGEGGATLFSNTGAFPSTVLQEGDYLVFAKRGDQVFNRAFEVQPGQPKEIEVLTAVY
ncbi:MAG: hypothetical protein ABIQ30_10935 [Devosia sp.]